MRMKIKEKMIAVVMAFAMMFTFIFAGESSEVIAAAKTKALEINVDFARNAASGDDSGIYVKSLISNKKITFGKSFIYGNTPMMPCETSSFLIDLGMIPKLIQLRELYNVDLKWKKYIVDKGYNPYVTRIANIAPLRELYSEIGADIYIGHENPMLLKSKGLKQITLDNNAQKIGYELPIAIMNDLINKFKD